MGSSALAPGYEHDAMMSDVGDAAEAFARVAECEQQSDVLVERVVCVGDDMGGWGCDARRGHEGEGGVEGRVGADGAEQRAMRAVHEAEGDDWDEDRVGDENIPLQRAEGGNGPTGGIKKRGQRGRSKESKAERRKPNKYGHKAT